MAERRYEQRLRAEAAEETRRRILDTVHERLRTAPSQPVSVDEVARRAGVARSTVYVVFGSRAGLFEAVAADLMERSGYARLLEAIQAPDAREVLRGGVRAVVELYAADRDVQRALYSLIVPGDETVGGAMRRMEEDRALGMRRLAEGLAGQGVLRPDLAVGDAADLLWLLTSFDAFDLLYTGRGRSVDEIVRILVTSAERALYR